MRFMTLRFNAACLRCPIESLEDRVLLSSPFLDTRTLGRAASLISLESALLEGEPRSQAFAVGAGAGGMPQAAIFGPAGDLLSEQPVFAPEFTGGVRVAMADVDGDQVDDLIVGNGPGQAPRLKVFRVVDNELEFLWSRQPFEDSFRGGVFVAAGDINGDGFAEVVVSPDEGGGPRVQVLDGQSQQVIADFFAIEDGNFRGGVRPALGDLNADGLADLLVAAGFGGGPRVAGFTGQALASGEAVKLFPDFFLFEPSLRNGAYVALGDLNADGFADVIGGGGPGGGPRVLALSGVDLISHPEQPPDILANFFAGNEELRGGIRVASKYLNEDPQADLIVGSGEGELGRVIAYLGNDLVGELRPESEFAFNIDFGAESGVFVG